MNEKPVSKSSQPSPKMQQIERYGVIALVFLLVTIVAVSFWGDSKSPGFWARLTGKTETKKETPEVATAPSPLVVDGITNEGLPLSGTGTPQDGSTIAPVPLVNGNMPSTTDTPLTGTGVVVDSGANAFAPNAPVTASPTPPVVATQPQPTTPAPAAGLDTYTVQKGDSLALIAKRKLGAESRWTEIQEANPGLDPKRLTVGKQIRIPAGVTTAALPKTTANAATKVPANSKKAVTAAATKGGTRSYTIRKGDVLRSIARAQLGDEGRWAEIQKLNPNLDPRRLSVGQTIQLPGGSERRASSPSKPAGETALVTADKPKVK